MPNLIKMSVSIVILFGSQVLGNKERKKTKQNKTTILPSKEFQFGPLYPFSIYLFIFFFFIHWMLPSCFCLARSKTHPSLHGWLNCRCQPWFIRNHDNNSKERGITSTKLNSTERYRKNRSISCSEMPNWNVMTIESYFFRLPPITHTRSFVPLSH